MYKTVKQIKEDKDPLTIWNAIKKRNAENRAVRRFIEEQNQNVIEFEAYLKEREAESH